MLGAVAALIAWMPQGAEKPVREDLRPGLVGEYFHLGERLEDFPALDPAAPPRFKRVDKRIDFLRTYENFGGTLLRDYFYVRWTGYLRVPKAGKYRLSTVSDDGSRLFIGERRVVENGGTHEMREVSGEIELAAGDHPIRVEYFDNFGHAGMRIQWEAEGLPQEVIPDAALWHPRERTPTEEERRGIEVPVEEPRRAEKERARRPEQETLDGEILKVGGGAIKIALTDDEDKGRDRTLAIDPAAVVHVDGRMARVEDLREGRAVRIVAKAGAAVRIETTRREAEAPPPEEAIDEKVVPKDGPRPDVWGRVSSLFEDGAVTLLTVRRGAREVSILLGADTKVELKGIEKPAPGGTVHVWLKPGASDQAQRAIFSK